MTKLFGYFEDTGDVPACDPGLDVDCPLCDKPLHRPVCTISLMVEGDKCSYFYRVHKGCNETAPYTLKQAADSMIIDAIYRSRETN